MAVGAYSAPPDTLGGFRAETPEKGMQEKVKVEGRERYALGLSPQIKKEFSDPPPRSAACDSAGVFWCIVGCFSISVKDCIDADIYLQQQLVQA